MQKTNNPTVGGSRPAFELSADRSKAFAQIAKAVQARESDVTRFEVLDPYTPLEYGEMRYIQGGKN